MPEVIIKPRVRAKFKKLLNVLLEEEYYSYAENALAYLDELKKFVNDLPDHQKYKNKNSLYGTWHCKYKANRRTTWYICFDTDGETYLVKNIINNHTRDYPTFIQGFK